MNNKFNFYRLEHNYLNSEKVAPFNFGPYFFSSSIDRDKLDELRLKKIKMLDSILLYKDIEGNPHRDITIKLSKRGILSTSLWSAERPGVFEDPYLRETLKANIKNWIPGTAKVKMENIYFCGSSNIDGIYKWFNFTDNEKIFISWTGFSISKYHVDNIVNGLRQSITKFNQNAKLIERIELCKN